MHMCPQEASAMTQKSHTTVTFIPSLLSLQSICSAWCVHQDTLENSGICLKQAACVRKPLGLPYRNLGLSFTKTANLTLEVD